MVILAFLVVALTAGFVIVFLLVMGAAFGAIARAIRGEKKGVRAPDRTSPVSKEPPPRSEEVGAFARGRPGTDSLRGEARGPRM